MQKSGLTLKIAKIPETFTSLKLVFLPNLGVLQTFSTNQTAANKQGIHGLLESGLPLNMVLQNDSRFWNGAKIPDNTLAIAWY